MEFNHFLSSYYPDTSYGGDRLYADMLAQARLADDLGYASVAIPEHHLINILLTPAPLQMAVKVAAETRHVKIVTSVVVLPLHDMRILAGEVIMADILTEGRMILGIGRGAFPVEMSRLGVPIETTREKFDESLDVLIALLTKEEVSWKGKYYNFDALTVMPRPVTRPMPQMAIGVLIPEAIYHCTKRGFHIQTTPLQGSKEKMLEQVDAFRRAKAEMGKDGEHLTVSLSRVAFVARNEADKREKLALANEYYSRFENVHVTGPGIVKHGAIEALPREQTIEEMENNLLVCTVPEMIDKLGPYAEAGIDEVIFNMNVGCSNAETLECMQRFAEEVMPHFSKSPRLKAAAAE